MGRDDVEWIFWRLYCILDLGGATRLGSMRAQLSEREAAIAQLRRSIIEMQQKMAAVRTRAPSAEWVDGGKASFRVMGGGLRTALGCDSYRHGCVLVGDGRHPCAAKRPISYCSIRILAAAIYGDTTVTGAWAAGRLSSSALTTQDATLIAELNADAAARAASLREAPVLVEDFVQTDGDADAMPPSPVRPLHHSVHLLSL